MFQRCLICTDFSDGLHRLTNFVPSLAASGIQQVVFFHSVPLWEEAEIPRVDEEKIEQVKERLSRALKEVPEGIDIKIEVPSGRPLDTIPRVLEQYQIDVIFTGMPNRSLLQEKVFGSTTLGLAKVTPIPLMILRPELISTYTREELDLRCQHLWRYLLLPYNDSDSAKYLLERVKKVVQQRPKDSLEQCKLLWVVDDARRRGVPLEHRLQEAQEKLQSVKAELEQLELEVDVEIRQGNPVLETLDAALTSDISAIAVGDNYRGSLLDWTVPSYANELLRRSWFPMLFFSPKK